MGDKYTIGLDFGTLSARGVLVRCRDGEVAAGAAKEYPHGVMEESLPGGEPLPPNWCLQHPGDYLEALTWVVGELMRDGGVGKEDIIGIGVDFTASTVMPIDGGGEPLCKAFRGRRNAYVKLWKHHGAQAQADAVNALLERRGEADSPRFGGAVSPELLVPKALEMLKEDPEVYGHAAEIIEAGDWITRVLTGSHSRSCSMAGYKAWWNPQDGYPGEDFFEALDPGMRRFAAEKLPGDVRGVGEAVGALSSDWAKRLGLKEGIPLAAAVIDSHAGAPGSGVGHKGQVMLVLGTSSVMMALGDKPYSEQGVCGGVRDAVVPGYYAFESGLAAVGDLFAWFLDGFVPAPFREKAARRGVDVYDVLNERAGRLGVGESGLLALDWWNGNKTPFVDGTLTGSIVGLSLGTKPEEVYRALVEATAFGTRRILELYQAAGAGVEEIVASGGIASKNPFLMQVYADVLGVDIRVAASGQAAALGSAIYASLAAGAGNGGHGSYREAVEHMTKPGLALYRPNPGNRERYDALYGLYREYSAVMGSRERGILAGLYGLRGGNPEKPGEP